MGRRSLQRSFVITVGSEEKAMELSEEYTDNSNGASSDFSRSYFGQPVDSTRLESTRAENQHLKRQLHDKEKSLNKYKNELAVMELEWQRFEWQRLGYQRL